VLFLLLLLLMTMVEIVVIAPDRGGDESRKGSEGAGAP
jgi:hypothetical protein